MEKDKNHFSIKKQCDELMKQKTSEKIMCFQTRNSEKILNYVLDLKLKIQRNYSLFLSQEKIETIFEDHESIKINF